MGKTTLQLKQLRSPLKIGPKKNTLFWGKDHLPVSSHFFSGAKKKVSFRVPCIFSHWPVTSVEAQAISGSSSSYSGSHLEGHKFPTLVLSRCGNWPAPQSLLMICFCYICQRSHRWDLQDLNLTMGRWTDWQKDVEWCPIRSLERQNHTKFDVAPVGISQSNPIGFHLNLQSSNTEGPWL